MTIHDLIEDAIGLFVEELDRNGLDPADPDDFDKAAAVALNEIVEGSFGLEIDLFAEIPEMPVPEIVEGKPVEHEHLDIPF